ncbi:SDR family NAD(P)-dependent oxidoreductase [Agromyces sp. ZXT2-3]|uniref:SDR family NAD(P)-dependent oxidoreductase n=1 Tax=Agromyces sp. ZXT2-3 TaxID=3461152 RepID=UPI004054E2F5
MRALQGTVVVTGATSGIGLATARRVAGRVHRVVVQGPEPVEQVGALVADLRREGADVRYVACDFGRLSSVVEGAAAIATAADGPIDGLVNNAGVPGADVRRVTADGHERTLQVNYLGMVLLTAHLQTALTDAARVVNLGSATHEMASLDLDDIELERGYSNVRAYARSKLAIIMYTRWLTRRLPGRATAVSLSPGVISTDLLHAMFGASGASVGHGAANVIEALTTDAAGGEYYDDGRLVEPSAEARDDRETDALMRWTARALAEHADAASFA